VTTATTNIDWDPEQYRRFADQRAEPFWDLAAMLDLDRPIEHLADLGCGGGELTAGLVDMLGARVGPIDALGVDSSPAMLAAAEGQARPGLRFEHGDIASWCEPGGYDVVFANASLQWMPDHGGVLERWARSLRPDGQLAVQVPANADHPSHRVAVEVAHSEPFLSAFDGVPPADPVATNVQSPEWYAHLLHELGFPAQHVRLQVYGHLLPSSSAVVEWVKGTSLTRFFKALPPELHDPFVERYRSALLDRIGDTAPFFYPFKRILMWAGPHRSPGERVAPPA
jgi:trans-aconitate 2-methyltransferase